MGKEDRAVDFGRARSLRAVVGSSEIMTAILLFPSTKKAPINERRLIWAERGLAGLRRYVV